MDVSTAPRGLGWIERLLTPRVLEVLAEEKSINQRLADLSRRMDRFEGRMDKFDDKMDGFSHTLSTQMAGLHNDILIVQNTIVSALVKERQAGPTRTAGRSQEHRVVKPHREPSEHEKGGPER